MLEQSSLLLHAWSQQPVAGGIAWIRAVFGGAGESLGFVQLQAERPSWFAWLGSTRLDVFETEDASHLMTVTRSWGFLGSWRIDDAEERHVGNLYGKSIVTSENMRIGFVDCEEPTRGCIRDLEARVIAHFVQRPDGALQIAFTTDLSANPFVRMLVLASILTLEPLPE